jgi:hypothetical protein
VRRHVRRIATRRCSVRRRAEYARSKYGTRAFDALLGSVRTCGGVVSFLRETAISSLMAISSDREACEGTHGAHHCDVRQQQGR